MRQKRAIGSILGMCACLGLSVADAKRSDVPTEGETTRALAQVELAVQGALAGPKTDLGESGPNKYHLLRQAIEIKEILRGTPKRTPVEVIYLASLDTPSLMYVEGKIRLWMLVWSDPDQAYHLAPVRSDIGTPAQIEHVLKSTPAGPVPPETETASPSSNARRAGPAPDTRLGGATQEKAYLGIVWRPKAKEAIIASIQSGSAADKAGMKALDTLTKVEDKPVTTPTSFEEAVFSFAPGQRVKIMLLRPNTSAPAQTWVNSLETIFLVVPGGGAAAPKTLTEEEQKRPFEQWTKEQMDQKGWKSYGNDTHTDTPEDKRRNQEIMAAVQRAKAVLDRQRAYLATIPSVEAESSFVHDWGMITVVLSQESAEARSKLPKDFEGVPVDIWVRPAKAK